MRNHLTTMIGIMNGRKPRDIEAEGFYHGSQGISDKSSLGEIGSRFAKQQEAVRLESVEVVRRIEAEVEILSQRNRDAESHWRKLEALANGMPPQIAKPLLAVISAALAVGGEMVLLAPVMDGFGIGNPDWQLFAAAVIVLSASGLCEMALHQIRPRAGIGVEQDTDNHTQGRAGRLIKVAMASVLSVFALSLITVLGWWRAAEMIFAASLDQSELGSFLGQHPTLTQICVTLLTIALPVFAAVAFDFGFARLRFAREWRRGRRRFLRFSERLNVTRKRLEAEIEKRESFINILGHQRDQWASDYLLNHEIGIRTGARQQPLWQVTLKIAAVTTLILAGWLVFDPSLGIESMEARALLCSLATISLSGLYAYYAIRSWDRPSPRQLLRHRAVTWRANDAPQTEVPIAVESLELPIFEPFDSERTVVCANGNSNPHQDQGRL